MGVLNRQQILSAADQQMVQVDVPEWGGSVHVRTLNVQEHLDMAGEVTPVRIVQACCCDASGALLFTPDDLEQLEGKSGAAMVRIVNAAMELNGFRDTEADDIAGN